MASPEACHVLQDKQANLANEALRRMPNGNLAAPLPGMVTDPNNKVFILLQSACDLSTSYNPPPLLIPVFAVRSS